MASVDDNAIAQAVPYGVYEVTSNRDCMYIGDCFDTPRFAVDAITDWWFGNGQKRYRDAHRLLILADAGGSNIPAQHGATRSLHDRVGSTKMTKLFIAKS